jgi:U5 small nuclear ribonucleoprotein component
MASFEDYDEFGNYIGADLDSDEEDGVPQNDFSRPAQDQPPLAGFDDDTMQDNEETALMEVDGLENYLT